MKPLVGISMSRDNNFGGSARDFVRTTYINAIVAAGGIPLLLANVDESLDLLSHCHGLLLTGGGDADPNLFGALDQGTEWSGVVPERDRSELAFLSLANRSDMPVFGICRGVQILAVGFGGTLIQDIPRARPDTPLKHSQDGPRGQLTHAVHVVEGSRVAEIVGIADFEVNSFHHQAIDRVPDGWQISAEAPDGVIEAIEHPGERFLMGVQWHPEDLVVHQEPASRLFQKFVDACRAYQAQGGNNVGNSH